MTLVCELCQGRLLEGERDDVLEQHLRECASCRAFELALRDVDHDLAHLGPVDAPDALVERTIARIEEASAHDAARAASTEAVTRDHAEADERSLGQRAATERSADEHAAIERSADEREPIVVGTGSLFAAALAAVASALGAVFMAPWLLVRALGRGLASMRDAWAARSPRTPPPRGARGFRWFEGAIVASLCSVVGFATWARFGNMVKGKIDGSTSTLDAMPCDGGGCGGGGGGAVGGDEPEEGFWAGLPSLPSLATRDEEESASHVAPAPAAIAPGPSVPSISGPVAAARPAQMAALVGDEDFHLDRGDDWQHVPSGTYRVEVRPTDLPVNDPASDFRTAEPEAINGTEEQSENRRGEDDDGRDHRADRGLEIDGEVRAELRQRDRIDDVGDLQTIRARAPELASWADSHRASGLRFQARDGWWQNTYVPGDPAIRLLQAQLAQAGNIPGLALSPLALAQTAAPTTPALAAPVDRAIAVGAHADVASIDGPTRVRVEVALRGIEQAAGRRGALRVAVVIDSDAPLGEAEQARARALVMALSRASGSRDRVMVLASGPRGGTLADLGPARAGRLEVALRRHFAPSAAAEGPLAAQSAPTSLAPTSLAPTSLAPTSLASAVTAALEGVASPDGAGLVLVVTPGEAASPALEHAIHLGTVAGITTSAVGLGPSVDRASLDAIALAGQGRRRILLTDDDATRVVRAELEAASQLVARALRVRIRLAPGVELVDILGSRPLDTEESRRTREVEQAVDRDLARRLGIVSDRDEDEEGLRMLLPSFYSGDSHTVLLDLVVPRAGHVLDVDVQLKDLVRVGNARASTSLTLESGSRERGPQELRVVASHLAHETAAALSRASTLLRGSNRQGAYATLLTARDLISAATTELPALAVVSSVLADRALLDRYLDAARAARAQDMLRLSDSLQLAAHRRVLRPRLAVAED